MNQRWADVRERGRAVLLTALRKKGLFPVVYGAETRTQRVYRALTALPSGFITAEKSSSSPGSVGNHGRQTILNLYPASCQGGISGLRGRGSSCGCGHVEGVQRPTPGVHLNTLNNASFSPALVSPPVRPDRRQGAGGGKEDAFFWGSGAYPRSPG